MSEKAHEISYRKNYIHGKGKSNVKMQKKLPNSNLALQQHSYFQLTRKNADPICASLSCMCYMLVHSLPYFWKTSDRVKSQRFDFLTCLILWQIVLPS